MRLRVAEESKGTQLLRRVKISSYVMLSQQKTDNKKQLKTQTHREREHIMQFIYEKKQLLFRFTVC